MATYRTPGVYVEEISTLPPSVAEVATAIPAFIGFTEAGPKAADKPVVRRITNMLEFKQYFGGPNPETFKATVIGTETTLERTTPNKIFTLYYALKLYFENGGGPCYIVSVGTYSAAPAKKAFADGLDAIAMVDEPTLLLFPEAVSMGIGDYCDVCNAALDQCQKLGDRFAILDVPDKDPTASGFRSGIRAETGFLKYGAAYLPFLNTSIPFEYIEDGVSVLQTAAPTVINSFSLSIKATTPPNSSDQLIVEYTGTAPAPSVEIKSGVNNAISFNVAKDNNTDKLIISIQASDATIADIVKAFNALTAGDRLGFKITAGPSGGTGKITTTSATPLKNANNAAATALKMSELNKGSDTGKTALYNQVKQALATQRVTLPPSPAIAGVYARVDRIRGVWKSPGNVSVVGISGPARILTSAEQEGLNVDATSGKSINVIRSFTGKGTLVWGARTLAGNDNEWRYVSVRRLFNLIEESVQKSTAFAVFEPNDAGTWLKVKAMIDSYLYSLWQQGALAGSVPEQAYFVHVGLGKTMNTQDILEGRMIVEIGIAAVRPAEFIILKFSHKLQEV